MIARYASARLPWRRLAMIAGLAGVTLIFCLAGAWMFYQALGHPARRPALSQFPAPRLNASNDRSVRWRLLEPPSPRLKAAIARSMLRVAARGDAGYDPGPP